MFGGGPRPDYSNYFRVSFLAIAMNHDQQAGPSYRSNRMPSLFTGNDPVWHDNVERIIPHFNCQSERDAVLDDVCCSLLRVPFESHGINSIEYCMHNFVDLQEVMRSPAYPCTNPRRSV